MTSNVKDPGAHTKQAEGYAGDPAAAEIRRILAGWPKPPTPKPQPAEPEEEPWR